MVRELNWGDHWTSDNPDADEAHKRLIALANAICGDDVSKDHVEALIDGYSPHLSAEERIFGTSDAVAAEKIREEMVSDLYLLRQMADAIYESEESDRDIAIRIILGIVGEHIRGQALQYKTC